MLTFFRLSKLGHVYPNKVNKHRPPATFLLYYDVGPH